jgi:hypothetical protein
LVAGDDYLKIKGVGPGRALETLAHLRGGDIASLSWAIAAAAAEASWAAATALSDAAEVSADVERAALVFEKQLVIDIATDKLEMLCGGYPSTAEEAILGAAAFEALIDAEEQHATGGADDVDDTVEASNTIESWRCDDTTVTTATAPPVF